MNTPILYAVANDIIDELTEFKAYTSIEILIYKKSTSNVQDVLMESIALPHNVKYSFLEPKIEEENDNEIINTSVATSKSLKFLLLG